MKLLILPTISDASSNVRYVLAAEAMSEPDLLLQRTISNVALVDPRYGWEDLARALESAGFKIPEPHVASQAWDAARDPAWGTDFIVAFPPDAPHEYAGQRGTATFAAAAALHIVLADHTVLTPWDRPFRLGSEGADQVPLGPLIVPREQFSDELRSLAAVQLLADAGFECAT